MDNLRHIWSAILKNSNHHMEQLEKSNIPVSEDPCRTCSDPCEFDHPEYPARFGADMTSEMLGSVKPYQRQVVISTGKTDWDKEVTEVKGSLAQHLFNASKQLARRPSFTSTRPVDATREHNDTVDVPGVFDSRGVSRLAILNGSCRTLSCDDDRESVLVFPDYKVVKDVERSKEGAELLWRAALDPALARAGRAGAAGEARSWPLHYSCVILLCSHKKRDNRCHIAAPILQTTLTHSLEREGYEVHTELEEPEGPPLEELKGTDEQREDEFLRRLRALTSGAHPPKKALILKNSHVGGHKFSGNVIIYTPQGSGVWYGRVTPHEVPAIVKATINEGRVLPKLLRGGVNLTRPKGKDLLDW